MHRRITWQRQGEEKSNRFGRLPGDQNSGIARASKPDCGYGHHVAERIRPFKDAEAPEESLRYMEQFRVITFQR
jgi:hypothetical protein